MHGHSYLVRVHVAGPVGPDGFVIDYAKIDWQAIPLVSRLDHQCLNDFFDNPTAEVIAAWFLESLPQASAIDVHENPRSKVTVQR